MALITATTALTVARANAWADLVFRAVTDTPPSSVYVGLLTGAPDDSGTYTEVSGTTRQAASFAAATARSSSTDADILFAAVGSSVAWVGIFDAASTGNLIAAGPITGGAVDPAGDDLQIAAGDLTMTVAYGATAGMSEALANAMLDHQLRSASYVGATTVEVALWEASGEVTGGSYARQPVTWDAASGGVVASSSAPEWTLLPACTVTQQRAYEDAGSGGMHLWSWDITPKAFAAGSSASNAVGSLTVSID